MKVNYDPEKDILHILVSDNPVEKTSENKPGTIIYYDKDGNFVGLGLLAGSERMHKISSWSIEVKTTPPPNSKVQAVNINMGGLDWDKATPEEIIADIRNSRVEREYDIEL